MLALVAGQAGAQGVPADTAAVPFEDDDGLTVLPDTVVALVDTLGAPAESPPLGVPVAPPAEGGLPQPVTYTARDSLRIVLAGPDTTAADRATLYGEVTAEYEGATLTAGTLELDFGRQELRALPAADSTGQPVPARFAQGEESFTGEELVYNLASERGRVVGARTAIEEGFLLGGVVKQVSPHVIYAADAAYTTCELDHPHYSLVAGRMKIVDAKYVYTGPVQLQLLGIPMPLWLPFGFFPAAEGRRSGPLPITYGEDFYGFYLGNVGWYWAVSDYFDALVRTKYGTRGSFNVGGGINYVRRYRYDGALDLSYERLRTGERLDPDFAVDQNVQIGWRHAQEFGPTARLNANVNLTSNARRLTTDLYEERVAQTSTSRIGFTKSWPRGGRSLGLDLSATQRLSEGAADLTLPSFSFNQQRLFPLRSGSAGSDEAWYEKLGVDYRATLTNTYAFNPLPDSVLAGGPYDGVSWIEGLVDYDAFRGATGQSIRYRPQAQHNASLGAAYTVSRLPGGTPFFLNLNPALRYTETWYSRAERRTLGSDGAVLIEQEPGFTPIRRASLDLSASSRFYGTFPLRIGPLDGLRHTVTPQLSFSYEPDYSAAPFNYFRTYTDTTGAEVEYPIVSGVPDRPTQRLGFSVGNIFQTRLARTDSTGETTRTPLQLLSLDLRSGYDFAADDRPLADVSLNLSSQLDRFRLSTNATFSPYALDSLGRPSPLSYLTDTGRLLRTTNVSFSLGASFSGGPRALTPLGEPVPGLPAAFQPIGYDPARPDYGLVPTGYTDFASPWSFSLDFTYGYTPVFGGEANKRAVLSVPNFDVSLTPNWKVAGSTSFDLIAGDLSYLQLSVVRDLHCWEARFNWIPLGDFRSFAFSIYVKSGYLRDLLRLDFPRADVRSQIGSVL